MSKIQVTYTFDRPPAADEAGREIARLDALPEAERPEDYDALRAALVDSLPAVEKIRITVRAISLMDRARYNGLFRRNAVWYRERHGHEIDATLPDDADELIHARAAAFRHAEVFCAIESTGGAKGKYLAELLHRGGDWQPGTIPEEWTTVDGFCDEMPLALADALIDATMELNGGVLPTVPFFGVRKRISTSVIA